MLLVTDVDGPPEAKPGDVATYRAVTFNQTQPAPADLAKINWEIQCDGVTVARKMAAGPTFGFEIGADLAGRTILAMPFANSPTERVSVKTAVAGLQQQIDVRAEVALKIDGNLYRASINEGPEFLVGGDVRYRQRRGLMNTRLGSDLYDPADFRAKHGFWADALKPTAMCESKGSFHCLNTYDRAAFTFGFFQEAAHIANENFVVLLRRLLLLPEARFYFPDLALSGGHVARKTPGGLVPLETPGSSQDLMTYLNPDPDKVGTQEAHVAAKFVHWAENSADHRTAQVDFVVEQQQQKYAGYARDYNLDGAADSICIVIADIRHQGRAMSNVILAARNASNPLGSLLEIGANTYRERIQTLRQQIDTMTAEGILGRHTYDLARRTFVPS